MNTATQQFVDSLQQNPDVLGIILFGSWARGNNRDNSDVDLLVIVREGFRRTVEIHDNQAFEIIYTTEQAAVDFWRSSPDEAVELWSIARILFDRDGTMARLRAVGEEIKARGKARFPQDAYTHLVFDVQDQMRTAQALSSDDPTTARLLLHMNVLQLTEVFFDLRQLWTPPPKQRLAILQGHDPALYTRIVRFYQTPSVTEQVQLVREIARDVLMY